MPARSAALAALGAMAVAGGLAPAAAGAAATQADSAASHAACIEVANDTAYWMPGSLLVPGDAPVNVRFGANQTTQACLNHALAPKVLIEVVIKSGWGLPIASCHLPPGGRLRIERRPDNQGKVETRLICF